MVLLHTNLLLQVLGTYSENVGYADATATGYNGSGNILGTGSIVWSTNDTTYSIDVSPNTSTNYSVTVTNGSHSCSDTVAITVIPSPIVVDTANPLTCFGDTNSTASLTVSGGATPYTYSWSTGASTSSISNLTAGNYAYTVTSGNNCTVVDSVEVVSPTEIVSIFTVNQSASCYGTADGHGSVYVSGGVAPYNVVWPSGTNDTIDTLIFIRLEHCYNY